MRLFFSNKVLKQIVFEYFIPEPTARSAVPGVSPRRGLLIPLGRKRSQKSINNRGRMGVMGGHLTDLKNTANNRSVKFHR